MEGRPEYEQEKREEKAIYANRQTDIKINQEYLDKLGLSVPEEPVEDLAEEPVEKPVEKPVENQRSCHRSRRFRHRLR